MGTFTTALQFACWGNQKEGSSVSGSVIVSLLTAFLGSSVSTCFCTTAAPGFTGACCSIFLAGVITVSFTAFALSFADDKKDLACLLISGLFIWAKAVAQNTNMNMVIDPFCITLFIEF
jgi:hypothetical protein